MTTPATRATGKESNRTGWTQCKINPRPRVPTNSAGGNGTATGTTSWSAATVKTMLNRLVPELTYRMVEKIFATDFEDWPAMLRAMRETGEEFRQGKITTLPKVALSTAVQ